jgi:protein tyrosine phosphatase (PTP) superfamily phosphohydrolase (DUF442 family)
MRDENMVKVSDIYNYRLIEDALSTSGQPTEAQLRAPAAEGYHVIINLALHDHPRYSLPDEMGLVKTLGMKYVHIPVHFDDPQEEDLLAFIEAMETHKNKKILVHCAANMRVTAFLGLYRVIKQGKTKNEAFEPMRTVWEPDDAWSSFISRMLAKHRKYKMSVTLFR